MWVPLVENNEYDAPGADYFIQKDIGLLMKQSPAIDTIVLACTHYPLLMHKISRFIPPGVRLISQGEVVARSLSHYLQRHPDLDGRCSKGGRTLFYTTDSTEDFDNHAAIFYGRAVQSRHLAV